MSENTIVLIGIAIFFGMVFLHEFGKYIFKLNTRQDTLLKKYILYILLCIGFTTLITPIILSLYKVIQFNDKENIKVEEISIKEELIQYILAKRQKEGESKDKEEKN